MLRRAMCVLAVLSAAAWTTAARAEGPGGTVSATGEATVKVLPSALRVEIPLNCTNANLDAAMKQLKQRREAALEKLKTLQADAATIRASTPTVTKSAPAAYSTPVLRSVTPAHDPYGPAPVPPTVAPPAVPPTFVPAPAPGTPPPAAPTLPAPADEPEPAPYRPSSTSPAVPPAGTYAPPAAAPAYPTYPMPAPAPTPVFPGSTWYSVSTIITADWPLEGKTIEALVAEVESLQAKIVAADLPGERPVVNSAADSSASPPDAPPRTAPARPVVSSTPVPPPTVYPSTTPGYAIPSSYAPAGEGAAPVSGRTPSYPTPTYCPPGTPCAAMPCSVTPPTSARFVCVSKLSDQQRKSALAEAFGKVKTQAAELAEAAGGKVGPVVSLERLVTYGQSNAVPGRPSDWDPYATPVCYPLGACGNEAVMNQPNEIEFRIQVQAQFRIE